MIEELVYVTHSPEETMALGRTLGRLMKGGELLALEGDLGTGKTHFIKGLAEGLEVTETVTSPTFGLIHEYRGRLPLAHFDVYRLDSPAELENLGYEEYFYGTGVTAVEWSDQIRDYLPEEYLKICFAVRGEQERQIRFTAAGETFRALLSELKQVCDAQHVSLTEHQ